MYERDQKVNSEKREHGKALDAVKRHEDWRWDQKGNVLPRQGLQGKGKGGKTNHRGQVKKI